MRFSAKIAQCKFQGGNLFVVGKISRSGRTLKMELEDNNHDLKETLEGMVA